MSFCDNYAQWEGASGQNDVTISLNGDVIAQNEAVFRQFAEIYKAPFKFVLEEKVLNTVVKASLPQAITSLIQ